MKIGLIDIDGHNFPNLALMKISAHHKKIGDKVEWVNFFDSYDVVYKSKVFTFSPDETHHLNCGEVIIGGTGYDAQTKLHEYIDSLCPDYSIYPKFREAYGFLTRGCPRKCEWCIVPSKEGGIRPYSDIEDFLDGRSHAVLMDNNVLAHDHGILQIEKMAKMGIKIDFNQGLDARLIDNGIAKLLSKTKWITYIRMACDTTSQIKQVEAAINRLMNCGVGSRKIFVYTLIRDLDESLDRILFFKRLNVEVFAQPYRDFKINYVNPEAKRMARWVNHKATFKSVEFKDYNG